MGISYCDGRRLKRLFLAGSEYVFRHRDELDRINVFPVPDGDTGTNLALTLRAMAEAVNGVDDPSVHSVASRIAEAGVLGARGNSGMMLSHYFTGFADGLDGHHRAGPDDLTLAMRNATDSLYQAVDHPVEGTILTVIRESTEALENAANRLSDLELMARELLRAARESLMRTPELLSTLREAAVVDAGAKGFVRFVEGVVALLDQQGSPLSPVAPVGQATSDVAAAVEFPVGTERDYRYCSEFVVRGDPLPDRPTLATSVRELGGSLIVNRASALAKMHIHTDHPEAVERALMALGVQVECVKAEDMRAQHRRRRGVRSRHLALVTDTTCDLPPERIMEHDITVVPLTVMFGDESFLDQVEITHDGFAQRLLDATQPQPTTSQPSPAQLDVAFARAGEQGEEVLGIFLSGALSGTLAQAQAAARRFAGAKVRVHDSRTASLGLGFQVLRAAELAAEGKSSEEVVAELERLRSQSGLLLTVDTLTYLQRSGRLGKARAFLGNLLDLKPILSVDEEGAVIPVDRARGREALVDRVLELLDERVPGERGRLRLGIAHVLCPEVAGRLARELKRKFAPDELVVRPAAGVISAHTGPGSWGVFYQVE